MQSGWPGYGVPEFQQFMLENSCSSLLSMSHEMSAASLQDSQNQLHHPSPSIRRFHQLNSIPVTQQLFQHHQFNPVQHFLSANFSAGANESRCSRDGVEGSGCGGGQETMLACHGSESRHVQREEESAIKEPFWKPLDAEYINKNNKRCKENLEISNKYCKKEESKENEEGKSTDNNYGLFSELEAIYTRSSGGPGGNHQTGSGSALTGDNGPSNMAVEGPGDGPRSGIDHESETSTGEEASLKKLQKSRRGKRKQQLSSIAAFFQSLVKQLMDHQEALHRKFMEAMERRDQERTEREEAWRRQEAAKSTREAMARAEEHALASSREAAIVSLLEKITGERIHLPTKPKLHVVTSQIEEEFPREERQLEEFNNNNVININDSNNTRRWPKDEVQALIRVRSGFESRFSEPGLKAPLWEEVSSLMAAMGYQRSAKRCKEKWENINKYFRKTKDSAKKRPQHSKTCPYFHQLDQLYSKTQNTSSSSAPNFSPLAAGGNNENSELLDSIVLPSDHTNLQNPSHEFVQDQLQLRRNFKFPEMGSFQVDFNGHKDNFSEASELNARQVLLQLQQEQDEEEEDQEVENEEEEEEEEEEGEEDEEDGSEGGEDQENEQNQGDHPQREHDFCP